MLSERLDRIEKQIFDEKRELNDIINEIRSSEGGTGQIDDPMLNNKLQNLQDNLFYLQAQLQLARNEAAKATLAQQESVQPNEQAAEPPHEAFAQPEAVQPVGQTAGPLQEAIAQPTPISPSQPFSPEYVKPYSQAQSAGAHNVDGRSAGVQNTVSPSHGRDGQFHPVDYFLLPYSAVFYPQRIYLPSAEDRGRILQKSEEGRGSSSFALCAECSCDHIDPDLLPP